jgi:hypothetical protein
MLIVSPEFKCSNEMLTIAAMMSGTPLHQWLPFLAEIYSNSAGRVDTAQQSAKRR